MKKVIGNISSRPIQCRDDCNEDDENENVAEPAKETEGWFTRAAEKISSAASKVTAKTASLLDFHTGAADVIFVRHLFKVIVDFNLLQALIGYRP